ncbi:ankyrin repeat protein [Cladorrhinum sp. PSN259]|nr:ankyrin repeat protein [Cladorrhinum sp. PSN259]
MASEDDYTVGWICALPLEMAAAKAMLDNIHADLPTDPLRNDTNAYIFGDLKSHNIVVACLPVGVYGTTSAAIVVTQMLAKFRNIRVSLMVGIGGGVPNTKEDVRLGDIVVSKPTASRPGILQYDFGKECAENQLITTGALNKPSTMLLTAAGKVEANSILGESQIPSHLTHIIQKDPLVFSHPGQNQDVVYDSGYDHASGAPDGTCTSCDPSHIVYRKPRITDDPKVHYGLIASGNRVMRHGGTRDRLAKQYGILCFEMEAAGLMDIAQCLVIRGICDYSDSHKSKQWQGYAAAAAAAYAKEILSLIPPTPKPEPLATVADPIVASVLNAVLLTRPEVDRSSLIVLKGRRVDGTCEWLMDHPNYRAWLEGSKSPLLWISGGPGKGKTMLSIYITEGLQPTIDKSQGILLYYFCSGRNKNMNTALTLMRGILHQWITMCPQYVQYIRSFFDGTETTKYTLSNLMCLWRVFSTMLTKSAPCPVTLVLDGLDECEEDGLRQLLDLLRELLNSQNEGSAHGRVRVIILSRPQPGPLESGLHMFPRIRLDEIDTEVRKDVERYIEAKVAELASEGILSADKLEQVRQALLTDADGTFLWVGFVANELKGKTWLKAQQVLHGIPKGLGGVYCRLLEQVGDKEILVPILQWVVLAARPLTVTELAGAAQVMGSDTLSPTEVLKERLASCGLLVKIDGGVVNLVHESAREFFKSDQVNREGISIFYMNHKAHRTIMRTCLALIEGSYKSSGSISNASTRDSLLAYAGLNWAGHFKQSIDPNETQIDASSLFFQSESAVREDWWNFYWQWVESGGTPPKFTLLHLAAYFGNLAWAKMLLKTRKKKGVPSSWYVSKKDSYGRTPLFWAATRGHRDVAELLLDCGAPINSKDQSKMTALHVAVTGEHKDVVDLLIRRSAKLEEKAYYDETPLMRAIQADSKDIVMLLLENGACTDALPIPPGFPPLRSRHDPIEERASQLMALQEALFAARYENQSKEVELAIKVFTHSLRFQPIFKAVSFYIRHISLGRWETLQDLVKNNETARLKEWALSWINFGSQFIKSRNYKSYANMMDLSIRVFEVVTRADLEALLVIGVMVGAGVMLDCAQAHWRDGVEISGQTYSRFASIAHRNDAEEFLDYGSRQFLTDFDACLRARKMEESVGRVIVLFSTHLAILADQESWPIVYFSTFIREFFEGYIGGPYEELLFSAAGQACANELDSISKAHASGQNARDRLFLVLTALLQLAQGSREKGRDWFLNVPPASCQILCQHNPAPHRWLISTGIPEILAELIPKQPCPIAQKRALKTFIECLIIGKQYDFIPPDSVQKVIKGHMMRIDGAESMLDRTINS